MKRLRSISVLLFGAIFLLVIPASLLGQTEEMVEVQGGTFMPFYSSTGDSVQVESFYIDQYAVTNGEYLEFVKANPKWRRSNIKPVFADKTYLKHWAGDLDIGPDPDKIRNSPVTNISWFAARAYAKWQDKRLPTLYEWEFAASASQSKPMASRDEQFVQQILDWYSQTNPESLPVVGKGEPNYYGVYDLHGLIWEWVQDFNTVFITGASRGDQGDLNQFYCAVGSSAASDADKKNYAAFLRFAFRGSLEADYSVGNLGFRCAMDK
jgi:formylglycine-generating enzyme required for sulfatase activity